ncbi:unnamed protein product, partial [Lota lota]
QPEWLQVMSDSEVEISSELHWSCMAAGKPRPSIRWLRNGQPLSTQVRMEFRPRAAHKTTLLWRPAQELLVQQQQRFVADGGGEVRCTGEVMVKVRWWCRGDAGMGRSRGPPPCWWIPTVSGDLAPSPWGGVGGGGGLERVGTMWR